MEVKKIKLKSKNILVTGGTGFIGSHLVEELLEYNLHKIVCFYRTIDPKSYFYSQKLQNKVILASGDIKNFKRVFDVLTKYEIEAVFHLAAQPIVGIAYKNPLETIETNIMGTVNILEACRLKNDLKSIVVASSDKAYGKTEKLPYTEETSLKGDHPYDVSKSSADLIARAYFKTYGLPITVTRFGNIFGPGDLNFNRVIPGIFKSILTKTEFLIRSDGKMVREYVYVNDVADGYIKLAKNIERIKGEAFNFGSKNVFSVIELIKKIEKILGIKIKSKILNIAKNEIPEQYLDWGKARKMLDWQPKYSFKQAIEESFAWYKNFL